MSHNYSLSSLAVVLGLTWAGNAVAINPPTVPSQTLTDGDTYLLMNYARPAKYWTRTSWDGAYYLLDYSAWKGNTGAWKPIDFTARKNEDGTWSFVYETTKVEDGENVTTTFYLGIPNGSGNMKSNEETPISWNVVEGDYPGYYKLLAGEDSPNELVIGHPLHLNGGGEYAIIYYEGNGWGFDIYQGIKTDDGDEPVYEDDYAEYLFPVFNSYDHTNWTFIHEADIEAYNAKAEMYVAITEADKAYYETDGFEEGINGMNEALEALYEAEGTTIADIKAVTEAKKALYDEILSTIERNEDGDSALQNAIDKATAAFNSSNEPDKLDNARQALKEALKIYLSGGGDFTSFGENMSFEDLSAQGGNTTTGVVNAPAGWNLYLNGQLCNTADAIRAQGVGAWCGINQDATGVKDGDHIFGIWNGAMPAVELSQTITGLENGTYYIEAAVMVGANGGGSRMTTQRIFGNLNSALFGWEDDYNRDYLDPSEVYEFAGLTEPVTDTELQDMGVNAYVYDGTLTFGFRTDGKWQAVNGREGGNGAGGDGWFKVDNFRIQYLGYNAGDAESILYYYQDALANYVNEEMQTAVAEKAAALCDLSPDTEEEVNAAILECKNYIGVVKSSVDAYAAMREYLEACANNIIEYADYAGIAAYEKAVLDAFDAVDELNLDEAGLDALRQNLEDALTQLMLSGVFEGQDVTHLITNPSFEDLRSQNGITSGGTMPTPYGWNLNINGVDCATVADINAQGFNQWCAINNGDDISSLGFEDEEGNLIERQPTDGSYLWGMWGNNIPEVELSQTIEGLPSGTYTMTADVMVQWDWAGDNLSTQRIFANDVLCMYGNPWDYLKNVTPDMERAIATDRANGFYIEADDYLEAEEDEADEAARAPKMRAGELNDEDIDAYRLMNYGGFDHSEFSKARTSLLHTLSVKFVVGNDGVAKIGFRTNGIGRDGNPGNCVGWFKVDNFTLYYDDLRIPTAVEGVPTASQPATFYTLDGIRLNAPQRGINIMRQGGRTVKLLVK